MPLTIPRSHCMRCHAVLKQTGIQPQLCINCLKELGKHKEVKDMATIQLQHAPISAYQSFDVKFGQVKEENGYLLIPTTLAAEMIQTYHISEIPWLAPYIDSELITVFKDGDELKKAVDEYHTRGKDLVLPFVVPHTDGIYCEKQCPSEYKDMVKTFIKKEEIKGFVKDIYWDEPSRSIKGTTCMNISKNDPALIEKTKKGELTDVSIGFMCDWDGEGEFQGKSYMLRQAEMKLGHLAGLPGMKGKCSQDKCGLNKDHVIDFQPLPPIMHIHLKDEYYMKKKEDEKEKEEESEEEESEETEEKDKCGSKKRSRSSRPKSGGNDGLKYTDQSNLNNTEVSSMPTVEELQKLLEVKDKEILALKDAQVSDKVSKLETAVHDSEVKISALNSAIAIKDSRIAELEAKLIAEANDRDQAVKLELERLDLVKKLQGLNVLKIQDKDVASMNINDLKLSLSVLDAALTKNGLSQGTQAAHDAQLKPSTEPKSIGSAGPSAEKINAIVKPKGDSV